MKNILILDSSDLANLCYPENPSLFDFRINFEKINLCDLIIYQSPSNNFVILKNRYGAWRGRLNKFFLNMEIENWKFTLANSKNVDDLI